MNDFGQKKNLLPDREDVFSSFPGPPRTTINRHGWSCSGDAAPCDLERKGAVAGFLTRNVKKRISKTFFSSGFLKTQENVRNSPDEKKDATATMSWFLQ
jgi:hypothetical protein